MNNAINISFDTKTRRLIMKAGFHLVDVMRGFPSRRFNPKDKTWRMPLVVANIRHFESTRHLYQYEPDENAVNALANFADLLETPIHVPFPRHIYRFDRAKVPYEPMKHQDKMLDHTWGLKSSAWFAKMGTGKTYAAIHTAFARWEAGQIDGVMIICPSTLRATWRKELEKFATGQYDYRIHETKPAWLRDFYARRTREQLKILAVSVEGLGVSEALYDSACGFMVGRRVLVICDESSRIKNPEAKRTERTINLGAAADYRMILNGTPIALGIHDMWAQYEFLDPNIIGTGDYWAFKSNYLEMGGYEMRKVVGYKNVNQLMDCILPYTIEVGKDVLNLPPKVMKPMFCEATAEQKDLFRHVIKTAGAGPDLPAIKVENSLEKILRLRQITGGYLPRAKVTTTTTPEGDSLEIVTTVVEPLAENPKLDLLLSILEDNYAGTKFIIWTTFTHEIEHLRNRIADKYGGSAIECYYGATEMDDRSRIEDRYCRDSSMRFLLANPAAAGLGLTLISGENDVMVYYSGTSAYIDRAQSEDRAHRIGQKNSVVIIDLIMERTVDETIAEAIQEKMGIEQFVMERIAQGKSVYDSMLG